MISTSPTPLWSHHLTFSNSSMRLATICRACRRSWEAELEAQKKRLNDSFYNKVSHTYNGLCLKNRIYYSQFGIDPDGKTLYWMPEDKISITATRGKLQVSGSRDAGPKIRGWWHLCSAEIAGAPWLYVMDIVEAWQRGREDTPECRGNSPEKHWGNRTEESLRRGWYHKTKRRRHWDHIEDH